MLVTTECHNDILGKSMSVGKKGEKTSTSHKASRQVAAQDY